MSRRVILGNLGSGVFGLRCALSGFDVITDAGNDAALSFDSGWTDIVKVLSIGTALVTTSSGGNPPIAVPDPGFVPWIEARTYDGSTTVYDDRDPFYYSGAVQDGIGVKSTRGVIQPPQWPGGSAPLVNYYLLYLVYNVAVASQ
jgi:hypothetical protein